jgi:hypothetical protein
MKNEKAGSRRVISYDWNLDDYSGGRDSAFDRPYATDVFLEFVCGLKEWIK